MAFRRGFKKEAQELARSVRAELGIGPLDALEPLALAETLHIPVVPLSQLDGCDEARHHFALEEQEAFSAVTVFDGSRRSIIHNDAHSPGRQRSNISHELAHGLLLHPPSPALDDHGCRLWDQALEDEASYLGARLLITDEAAVAVVRAGLTVDTAAARYGVSRQLMQWMINDSGAHRRVLRERQHRRRRRN